MTLILWDIDGTLIRGRGGRVSVRAFMQALTRASRLDGQLAYPSNSAGKTDTQIAREVLSAASLAEAESAAALAAFGGIYLDELQGVEHALREDLLVLPGVREALGTLQQLGITQSLLTGNLAPVARLKLHLAELADYVDFELGAFGSDHHDRTQLVPIARQRARRRFGRALEPNEIVLVGDTPRDIACARAGGAHVVAVATGNFARQDLESHQPDAVLDDLTDTQTVIRTLLRYSTLSGPNRALIV